MPEHEHGHGLQRERPPPALVGQHGVEEGQVRGVERRPVAAMDAQFERLVPLEHQDRPGPAAGGQHGGDLPPAQGQVALEALEVRRLVPEGTVRQAEEELAVHLGEAPQPEPPEQVVGVVDGAVVGADDVPRADRVVVAVDALVAAGAPAGVAHEEGGPVVHPGQDLLERLVGDELPGRYGSLEEPVLAVAVEPGDAGGVRAPALAQDQEPGEEPRQVVSFLGAPPLLSEDDARQAKLSLESSYKDQKAGGIPALTMLEIHSLKCIFSL